MNASFIDTTPSWATVDPAECSVRRDTSGGFCVLDHSIQSIVATSETAKGCYQFLNSISPSSCPSCGMGRWWDGGGYWCPPCDDATGVS